jgi:hypothetical protein
VLGGTHPSLRGRQCKHSPAELGALGSEPPKALSGHDRRWSGDQNLPQRLYMSWNVVARGTWTPGSKRQHRRPVLLHKNGSD